MTGGVWIVVTAVLLAAACAWVGSFLLLRRMALLGDVISHAVLPGIVLAYLWSGVRVVPVMLGGALLSALLAVLAIQALHRWFGWHSDTAAAAVLSAFFASGVLLLSLFGGSVDLDMECVLYGDIAYVPLDMVSLAGGWLVFPRAVVLAAVVLLLVGLFGILAYRELVVSIFDPEFAAAIGTAPGVWQSLLLGLTAVVAVVGFELVGVILLVALLVLPAATARLITARLPMMVLGAIVSGIGSAIGGYFLALAFQGAIAGWIALAGGMQFVVVFAWNWLRQRLKLSPSSAQNPFGAE